MDSEECRGMHSIECFQHLDNSIYGRRSSGVIVLWNIVTLWTHGKHVPRYELTTILALGFVCDPDAVEYVF